jgi:hypothetical protein
VFSENERCFYYKDKKTIDSEFGIAIDVSLDSNNGVFRRYHVGNNPLNRKDPKGTFWCDVVCTGIKNPWLSAFCSTLCPDSTSRDPNECTLMSSDDEHCQYECGSGGIIIVEKTKCQKCPDSVTNFNDIKRTWK